MALNTIYKPYAVDVDKLQFTPKCEACGEPVPTLGEMEEVETIPNKMWVQGYPVWCENEKCENYHRRGYVGWTMKLIPKEEAEALGLK